MRIANEILMFFRSKKKGVCDVSINDTIDIDKDGNPLTYLDIIGVEEPIERNLDLKVTAEKMFVLLKDSLSKREQTIIVLRYGLGEHPPMTQREIAKKLKISRSYVSRIEKKALEKLKDGFSQKPHLD